MHPRRRNHNSFTDEMQQKFGEESVWVYEVLRYAIYHVNGSNLIHFKSGRGIDRAEGKLYTTKNCGTGNKHCC